MSNTIATTILDQLGGRMFVTMTGAKNLLDHGNGLSMKIGRNAQGVSHVKIILDPSDTYSVQFLSVRGVKVTEKATMEGVYADQLTGIFETHTGLYTSI